MQRLLLLLVSLLAMTPLNGQQEEYKVSVFVNDHNGKPLDTYTRVFFYRGKELVSTENLKDGGECTLLIRDRHIDTIRTTNGRLLTSSWQAIVLSGEGIPMHSQQLQVNFPDYSHSPLRITVDTATQSLSGIVIQGNDEKPVKNALVRIKPSSHLSGRLMTKSDSSGYFKFDGLPRGNYPVELSFEGKRIAAGQKTMAYIPHLNPLEVQLEVYPPRYSASIFPVAPLTGLKYAPSRALFIGESVSVLGAALSYWRIEKNEKHYFDANTQQDATVYNTRGNFFKTAFIVSAGSFLTFYTMKLLRRKRHKP